MLPARLSFKPRSLTPEHLNVAPDLVGAPLADPRRRAAAMVVDLVLVALLSGVSGFWLLGGLALVVLQLRSQRGGTTRRRQIVGWMGAGLIALLVLQEARTDWLTRDEPADEDVVAAATPAAAAAASAPTVQERIAQLETQLAEARKPLTLRRQLDRLIDAAGASFGWGIVYFSLLPAWWGGQTVGKKIFGLRVVELTGQPMTVMRCLKRYGGYAAGMATGGLGFAQLLWDPNRQALQDKAAHTAVLDLRAARSPPPG